MIVPEEYRHEAVQRALKLLEDPTTEVVAVGKYGAVIRDKEGNELSVTKDWIDFTTREEREKRSKRAKL